MFKTLAHTADIGLQIEARDLSSLFSEAGKAFTSLIVANQQEIRGRVRRNFLVEGGELDYLLLDWLSELLYTFDTERLLFSEFEVSVEPNRLVVTAIGEPLDVARHRLDHEVKAITYHGLDVHRDGDLWSATVLVDI